MKTEQLIKTIVKIMDSEQCSEKKDEIYKKIISSRVLPRKQKKKITKKLLLEYVDFTCNIYEQQLIKK